MTLEVGATLGMCGEGALVADAECALSQVCSCKNDGGASRRHGLSKRRDLVRGLRRLLRRLYGWIQTACPVMW